MTIEARVGLWSLASSAVTTPVAISVALAAQVPQWAVPFAGVTAALFTLAIGVTWGPRWIGGGLR